MPPFPRSNRPPYRIRAELDGPHWLHCRRRWRGQAFGTAARQSGRDVDARTSTAYFGGLSDRRYRLSVQRYSLSRVPCTLVPLRAVPFAHNAKKASRPAVRLD